MRFFKYHCPKSTYHGQCSYPVCTKESLKDFLSREVVCEQCGKTSKQIETIWEKISDFYVSIVPFNWRPPEVWYRFKCWAWHRYTTIKPRTVGHTWVDRRTLLPELVFETTSRFIEDELQNKKNPQSCATEEGWNWHKVNNPEFYQGWKRAVEICNWWKNEYDESFPWHLSEAEHTEHFGNRSKFEIENEYYIKEYLGRCKELIDLSIYFWT